MPQFASQGDHVLQSDSGHVPAAGVDHAVAEIGQFLFMYAYDGWLVYVAPHTQRSMDTKVWTGLVVRMILMICDNTSRRPAHTSELHGQQTKLRPARRHLPSLLS